MATIKDTLEIIPHLQKKINEEGSKENVFDEHFLTQLHNYLGVYYLDLLAHACLNSLDKNIDFRLLPSAYSQYKKISNQQGSYQEAIRIQNISGLFILWGEFEQFIFRHTKKTGKKAGDFQAAHRKVMGENGISRKRIKIIEKTFFGIRRTRNSLHSGGVYFNEDGVSYNFELSGCSYVLEHNKPVQPIRLINLIEELLDNYIEIESSENR